MELPREWIGRWRGGSGKWMAATLNSVVAAVIVLADCGFLKPPWDGVGRGEGSGKWMGASKQKWWRSCCRVWSTRRGVSGRGQNV